MSPFAASNFESPLAATEEAGNDSECHACTFRTNSCTVQLQRGRLLGFADAFQVQMDLPSASRGEPATKVETEAHITGHSCFV